jgi:hypothetical protein
VNPPFRADHVGSLLRPKALLDARRRFQQNSISKEQLRQIEDQHIRAVVLKQEALGSRSITDEFHAPSSTSTSCGGSGITSAAALGQSSVNMESELCLSAYP